MTYEQLNSLPVWESMPTITLDEMSSIKLMNRVDTKFVLSEECCHELLRRAVKEYSVQVIGDVRACRYSTLYYDTADLDMYTAHHNRRLTRQKIRTRIYVESGTTFIEVKNKTNRGRTKKKRIAIDEEYFADVTRSAEARAFLDQRANYPTEKISPALITKFDRITLVNRARTERLTIDMNLRFMNMRAAEPREQKIDRMVIVELKQDGLCHSPMKEIMLDLRVKRLKVSKYCIGTALTNPTVKANRFKQKLRLIHKALEQQKISEIYSLVLCHCEEDFCPTWQSSTYL